jgi:hypothetical protein
MPMSHRRLLASTSDSPAVRGSNLPLRLAALLVALAVSGDPVRSDGSTTVGVTTTAEAEALAERMLGALGGRAAWAAVTSTVNDSQQNRAQEPSVVRAVITMDYTRPRFRIETTGPGLRVVRVIDGQRHWRLTREGRVEPLPAALLAEDLAWYGAHVYRTLHRIAARDPALALAVRNGRLEVFEGGKRLAWYALDPRGEPYAYGVREDDEGSLFGPWEYEHESGGIRQPLWVSSRDGTWRAMVKSNLTNVPLDDARFEQPRG